MSERTKTIELTTYVCDLCGHEEEPNEYERLGTVRITVQRLDEDGIVGSEPATVTVDVCANCQGWGRRKKSGDPGIRALIAKLPD